MVTTRRQRQHPARGARLPRVRAQTSAASTGRTSSSPRPPTRRSTRRATCSASRCDGRRSTRTPTQVDVAAVGEHDRRRTRSRSSVRRATTATARSTRSPSSRSSRSTAASASTSTAASAGSSCRAGSELGYDIPLFDFRVPGVTRSRPTPTSTATASRARRSCAFRDKALRNSQYFFMTDWSGGKYCSPGIEGSRSGGLLAATWAAHGRARP